MFVFTRERKMERKDVNNIIICDESPVYFRDSGNCIIFSMGPHVLVKDVFHPKTQIFQGHPISSVRKEKELDYPNGNHSHCLLTCI